MSFAELLTDRQMEGMEDVAGKYNGDQQEVVTWCGRSEECARPSDAAGITGGKTA